MVIRLLDTDGIEGIGWCYRLASASLDVLASAANQVLPRVAGANAHNPGEVTAVVDQDLSIDPRDAQMIRSAIDIACWDIKAKSQRLPLHSLLGTFRTAVPAYASGDMWRSLGPDELRTAIFRHREAGFNAFKIRIGGQENSSAEMLRLSAARDAAGMDVLIADANQAWNVSAATMICPSLLEFDLAWLEDPVPNDLLSQLPPLVGQRPPICAGEHCYNTQSVTELLDAKAIDILMLDVFRVGGVSGWIRCAEIAQTAGITVVSHLCPEVSIHLMAATKNAWMMEYLPASERLFASRLELHQGSIIAPTTAGLGLELH